MGWLGKPQGVFNLHESDATCGSFLSLDDAAEILAIPATNLEFLPTVSLAGRRYVNENELQRAWSNGRIPSPHSPKVGNATRSFDELILRQLIELTLPEVMIEEQVSFGRKRCDLRIVHSSGTRLVEFLGPSHFIPQYQRPLRSPLERKAEIEDALSVECVLWPYWIQRCSRNVRALFDGTVQGLASIWSTNALFGDFSDERAADLIVTITERFHAISSGGVGYMYTDERVAKPVHPIINEIRQGRQSKNRLIPPGNTRHEGFWLPSCLL